MRRLCHVMLALACCGLWGASPSPVHGQGLPKGKTGLPIGSYLTIEGVREDSKFYNFKVEIVNGKKLLEPLFLEVDWRLVCNVRYVLKGYETIQMIGIPPAVDEADREAGRAPTGRPVPWQVYYSFVTLSVVSPKDAKLIPKR